MYLKIRSESSTQAQGQKYCFAEYFEIEICFYFVSDIPSSSSWHCHCNTMYNV